MDVKRLTIGTVVAVIVIFGLGRLIFSVMFADFYAANAGSATDVAREEFIWWSIIVGYVFYALAINLGLELRKGASNVTTGLIVGAVAGALIWGTVDFVQYGATNVSTLTATVVDTVLEALRGAITGAVVVVVLGFVSGKPASA